MEHVVVGIIYKVVNGEKLYLFMSSKKNFGEFTGLFYPVGGHLEFGEDEETALKREVKEELGIEAMPIEKIAESPGDVPNQITHWWKCKPLNFDINLVLRDDEYVREIKWLSKDQIKSNSDLLWPATYNFFSKYIF